MNRNAWIALYLIALFSVVGYEAAWGWGNRNVIGEVTGVTTTWINGREDHRTVSVTYDGVSGTLTEGCGLLDGFSPDMGILLTYTPASPLHGPIFELYPPILPTDCTS